MMSGEILGADADDGDLDRLRDRHDPPANRRPRRRRADRLRVRRFVVDGRRPDCSSANAMADDRSDRRRGASGDHRRRPSTIGPIPTSCWPSSRTATEVRLEGADRRSTGAEGTARKDRRPNGTDTLKTKWLRTICRASSIATLERTRATDEDMDHRRTWTSTHATRDNGAHTRGKQKNKKWN